jgi:hypothetical protein
MRCSAFPTPSDCITDFTAGKLKDYLIYGRFTDEFRYDTERLGDIEKALTPEFIKGFVYPLAEYNDCVWNACISKVCPEPFKFHINTARYVKEERWKTNLMDAVHIRWSHYGKESADITEFDKFKWREVWLDPTHRMDNLYAIDLEGMDMTLEKLLGNICSKDKD